MIRYNYYIDNMPMQDLNELDSEQKKRLENLCKTKKLEQEVFFSFRKCRASFKKSTTITPAR